MAEPAIQTEKGTSTLPVRKSTDFCNARTKSRKGYCQRPAGWGTLHYGKGRCKLHGGNGGGNDRFGLSKNRINTEYERRVAYYLEGPGKEELLQIEPLLAKFNALFDDWVARYEPLCDALEIWANAYERKEVGYPPPKLPDLAIGYRVLAEAAKAVQKYQQFQLDGSLKLDLWRRLTADKIEITLQAVRKLLRQQGMRAADADAFLDQVRSLAAKLERDAKK